MPRSRKRIICESLDKITAAGTSRDKRSSLGGAVGDALGAPVEFQRFRDIVNRFGPQGISEFAPAYGRLGAITDDTQMTLFTAEGLLRGQVRWVNEGICHLPSVVHRAYLRWLKTQGESPDQLQISVQSDGWLINVRERWSRRAPGVTCLSALRETNDLGEPASNNSKGCGGVMRIAPVGLAARPEMTFQIGSEVAALTHGHPSGYLSAGYLALVIGQILNGSSLSDAIETGKASLIEQPNHEEVLAAIEVAQHEARSVKHQAVSEQILGEGWTAEEALSIALYSSLVGRNFEKAVSIAVNHSGDSDSTGAITGNICGVIYGVEAIPGHSLNQLEMREQITAIALDLLALSNGTLDEESERTWERYPGY
jgi:ADP-ribosylglycohydrolase